MDSNLFKKFKNAFWPIEQVFKAAPKEAVYLAILLIIQGITPALSLIVIQKVINWIINPFQASTFPFIVTGIWGFILLIETIGEPILALSRLRLNEKVLAHCNLLIMRKANSIEGLELFEDFQTHNEAQFLKEEAKKRPLNYVYIIAGFFREVIAIGGIIGVLGCLQWWLPFLVVLSAIPHGISTVWFEKQSWDLALFRSPESRKMAWLSSLTLEEKAAKEIRLFGFGDFLVSTYVSLARTFQEVVRAKRSKVSVKLLLLSSLTVIGHFSVFVWLIFQARSGLMTAGYLVAGLQALVLAQKEISLFMQNLGMLTPTLLFFQKFREFLSRQPPRKGCALHFTGLKSEIVFDHVSFQYPDGREALKNVSFILRAGEKIALVGENGAGKSTLIKLLLRFYEPTQGRILIDGIDLRDLDIFSWRKGISAVFQDFGQYYLTAAENIGIGDVRFLDREEMLKTAAEKGGFSAIAELLPDKYQTLLGKEFGGTNLSGGQWQKLAMARAFMKEADILIFDEPTASLDPRSEHEIFQKFAEVSKGKTAILITHRLGSVSMADQIVVLQAGMIIEEGSHDNLFQAGNAYHRLYSMQADRYKYCK